MGEIEIAGKDALAAVQRISSNDASKLAVGQAQYSGLLTPQGTFVDDLLVYRLGPAHFLLVVNAGNIAKDYAWMAEHIQGVGDAVAVDSSSRYALIAVQGPEALNVLQPLTGVDLAEHEVLLVRPRRSRQRPRHRVAHRLHRRGRLRNLRAAGAGRQGVARAARVGQGGRRHPVRPRRARHAAPRSRHAPPRQRHRRIDDRRGSGSELDRRLEEGRLHRRGRASRAEGERPGAQDRRLRNARARHRPPRLRRLRRRRQGRRRHQRHPDAAHEEGHRHGLPADRAQRARHRIRRRHPRPPHPRARRADAFLQEAPNNGVSRRVQIHQGPRVGRPHRRYRARSASPTTPSSSSATSSMSSFPRSARR